MTNGQQTTHKRASGSITQKIAVLAIVLAAAGILFWSLRGVLSLEYLASQEAQLRAWQVDYPLLSLAIALVVYIAVAGLSLPGATVLTLVCGWYFGFWRAMLIVSFGSTGGATLAFLISRYLLRDWIQTKMAERLSRINAAFESEGPFYLFTLRLIPAVPFFVINAVMGLTRIRATTFWWVSQLGMLPGTAAYVYAGSAVPSLERLSKEGVGSVFSWQLALAFAFVGLLPLAIKKVIGHFKRSQPA